MGIHARLRLGLGPSCPSHPGARAACKLTRGRTRYCDYDGLCQHVQVRAVSTKAQAAAGTCLILRQTLGCEGRNQEFSALVILGLVSQGS